MGISVKQLAIVSAVAPLLAACVSTGQYNKDLADTRSQIAAEKDARTAADNTQNADIQSTKTDVAGLKTNVAGLHSDLQNLRTEFGARSGRSSPGFSSTSP